MSAEVAYLRARYDEEETDARSVPQYNGDGLWVLDPQYDYHDHTRVLWISPAHVLADLAAKRKILDMEEARQARVRIGWPLVGPNRYGYRPGDQPPTSPIIQALLQPYADRDDFDPGWSL